MNYIERNNSNKGILIEDDEDTFTFGPKDFLKKKTLNDSLLNDNNNSKKKFLIKIPLQQKTHNLIKNNFNNSLLKERLNKIEIELNNILIDNDEENNTELYDLKNEIKNENYDFYRLNLKEKKKFNLKEKFNILCFFITDVKEIIHIIYKKSCFHNLYYQKKINEKTEQIILIIEKVFKNIEYFNKIYPIEKIYNIIAYKYNIQNYSLIELRVLKNGLKEEYLNYKGNISFFYKLIRIIYDYLDKIKNNIKNQLRIIEIYTLMNQ